MGPGDPPVSWRSGKSETDVVGKATIRQKGPLGPSIEFEDQTSWWEDAEWMRTCPRETGPPGPRLSSPGERERHTAMSGGAGAVNILQSLFGLQLPLTHTTFQIKWKVYLLKKSSLVFIIVSLWFFLHESAYEYTTPSRWILPFITVIWNWTNHPSESHTQYVKTISW